MGKKQAGMFILEKQVVFSELELIIVGLLTLGVEVDLTCTRSHFSLRDNPTFLTSYNTHLISLHIAIIMIHQSFAFAM